MKLFRSLSPLSCVRVGFETIAPSSNKGNLISSDLCAGQKGEAFVVPTITHQDAPEAPP